MNLHRTLLTFTLCTSMLICISTSMHARQDLPSLRGSATLHSLRDRYRPLLVFAPTLSPEVGSQIQICGLGADELRDRGVVFVPVISGPNVYVDNAFDSVHLVLLSASEQTAARRRFHIHPNDFTVILIGKDGGEKLRSHTPITLDTLRSTIDAMPMRQEEMRSKPKP